MTIKVSFSDREAWFAAKPAGYFTIERWGNRWAIIVHRPGCSAETIIAKSEGEMNRIRLRLSDEGLAGFDGSAR